MSPKSFSPASGLKIEEIEYRGDDLFYLNVTADNGSSLHFGKDEVEVLASLLKKPSVPDTVNLTKEQREAVRKELCADPVYTKVTFNRRASGFYTTVEFLAQRHSFDWSRDIKAVLRKSLKPFGLSCYMTSGGGCFHGSGTFRIVPIGHSLTAY